MDTRPLSERVRRSQGKAYTPHCGMQARTRRLRQTARRALVADDSISRTVVASVYEATAAEPHPEYGALHILVMALETEDGTGIPWQQAVVVFLAKFEERPKGDPDFLARSAAERALNAPKAFAARAVLGADVTVDLTVPPGEVHFRNGAGELLSVIKTDVPPLAPSQSRIKALWHAARESWKGN